MADRFKQQYFHLKGSQKIRILMMCVMILVAIVILVPHEAIETTENNANPEVLYQKDKSIDFVVYQGAAYVNAKSFDWVQELELNPKKLLGEVQRTNVKSNYKEFDATKLQEHTKIYSSAERNNIILVLLNEEYVPYYKYAEG